MYTHDFYGSSIGGATHARDRGPGSDDVCSQVGNISWRFDPGQILSKILSSFRSFHKVWRTVWRSSVIEAN